MNAISARGKAQRNGTVPEKALELVHLRASQINGCSFCVDYGARSAKKAGETDERLFAVAAWREAAYFTDAEPAGLSLTEAATPLADRAEPGPDETSDEASRHYAEPGTTPLVLFIAPTNPLTPLHPPTPHVA